MSQPVFLAAESNFAPFDPLLDQLCRLISVPGNESPVAEILSDRLKIFGELKSSRWGDLICSRTGNQGQRIKTALAAHMDSPGFIVQQILDDGLLKIIPMGGIQAANGHLRPIRLRTAYSILPGILHRDEEEEEETKAVFFGHFGFSDADEATAAGIRKGDVASWALEPFMMNNLFAAPHLDNRAGCTAMIRAAEILSTRTPDSDVYYLASTCEETRAQRGGVLLAHQVAPDFAVVLDTTYENDDVKLGAGPVLTLYDDAIQMPMSLRDRVIEIAAECKIPLQLEVYNYAGTDARPLAPRGANGCITLPLLIATRFNHAPVEILDPRDLKHAAELAAELICRVEDIIA